MANNINNQDELLKMLNNSGEAGKQAAKALNNNNLDNILNSINKNDADKIRQILNDEQATKMILESKQGKMLLKKFFGDKGNG